MAAMIFGDEMQQALPDVLAGLEDALVALEKRGSACVTMRPAAILPDGQACRCTTSTTARQDNRNGFPAATTSKPFVKSKELIGRR